MILTVAHRLSNRTNVDPLTKSESYAIMLQTAIFHVGYEVLPAKDY